MSTKREHWGVVGGGILGLTLAHRLAQRGKQVTLLEAADHLGGLADAWQLGDVTWDRHYHVTLLSDSHLRGVLRELGLEDDLRWVETKTGFYTDGRLHSMSNSWEFLRFPPLALADKLRLAFTIWYASKIKRWQPLESILVADWLRSISGRRTFEKIWLPLLRAKLGENYEKTSAAFIWATISRMYAARRTGLKKEMFGYLPGGYARILKAFAERVESEGVEVRTCSPVTRISPDEGGAISVESHDRVFEFDRAVVTTPAGVAARMLPELSAEELARLGGVEYQGIVCASLLLKRPLAQYYVTNITDAGLPFTAVIEMTALVDPAEFGGRSIVYLPKYVPSADAFFARSDDEIRAEFLAGLSRMYPDLTPEDMLAFRLSRVKCVMAVPTLDYSHRVPHTRTSIPGVFLVNSAQIVNGTLNVNETIRLAEDSLHTLDPVANAPRGVLATSESIADGQGSSAIGEARAHAPAACELVARS